MNIGVVFPQLDVDADRVAIRDFAQGVEGLGFDFLVAYDHILGANPNRFGWVGQRPYTYRDRFHEVFVLFGYLTGITEKLGFATGVLVLPQRQTALVAKQAAQISILCNNEFRLGVGVGWNDIEYAGLGCNFHNRGRRIEEQIKLLHELWSNDLVSFKGEYESIDDAGINPLPENPPIIWMGGVAKPVIERMVKLARGWFVPSWSWKSFDVKRMIDVLHNQLIEAGRKPEDFGLEFTLNIYKIPKGNWKKLYRQWQALGATHVSIDTMRMNISRVDMHLSLLKEILIELKS